MLPRGFFASCLDKKHGKEGKKELLPEKCMERKVHGGGYFLLLLICKMEEGEDNSMTTHDALALLEHFCRSVYLS